MMEVYDGHSHAQLCLISCCSNFWVDTICYTDLVQNVTIFDHSRIDKNGQKSLQNTTLRHQDLEEHHRKIHAVIWYQKLLTFGDFCKNCIFRNWKASTSVLEIAQEPPLLSIYLEKPHRLWMPYSRSLVCGFFHGAVIILEVTIGHFTQWGQVSKNCLTTVKWLLWGLTSSHMNWAHWIHRDSAFQSYAIYAIPRLFSDLSMQKYSNTPFLE